MENIQNNKISLIEFSLGAKEWNEIVFSLPNWHYLQTYEWGEFKNGHEWKPLRYLIFSGKEPVGVIQILKKRTVLGKSILYSPKGPLIKKGLVEDSDFWDNIYGELQKLAEKENSFLLKLEPQSTDDFSMPHNSEKFIKSSPVQFTNCTVINNLAKNEVELLEGMKKNARNAIRYAGEKRVLIKEYEINEGLKKFFPLYYQTGKRAGFLLRKEKYLKSLFCDFFGNERVRIFIAEQNNQPIAGAVVFIFPRKAWYAYGGSARADKNLHASYLLQFEIMKNIGSSDVKKYDLGGVPCQNDKNNPDGLYLFKSRFGGEYLKTGGSFDMPSKKFYHYYVIWNKIEPFIKRYCKYFRGDSFY